MKRKGFTFVELVATITIIVILSIISGPIYNSFAGKARLAEGYVLLGTIRTAQERYYDECGNFLCYGESSAGGSVNTCNEKVLGISAKTNQYYTSFCINTNSSSTGSQAYFFNAVVHAKGLKSITMLFHRNSGVTVL